MEFDISRVISAVESAGTKEAALNQLLTQPGPEPNIGESTQSANGGFEFAIPAPNFGAADLGDEERSDEGASSSVGSEGRGILRWKKKLRSLTAEMRWLNYEIDVTKEAEAINEYLTLLKSSSQ